MAGFFFYEKPFNIYSKAWLILSSFSDGGKKLITNSNSFTLLMEIPDPFHQMLDS